MKRLLAMSMAVCGAVLQTQALVYEPSSTLFSASPVPDNNNITGSSSVISIPAGLFSSITDIDVRLELDGGFNGDLLVYLYHDLDPALAVLMNGVGIGNTGTPGLGYTTAGLNVWFDDGAAQNIHNVENPSSLGFYQPDGRELGLDAGFNLVLPDDLALPAGYDLASVRDALATPAGDWVLQIFDLSGGGETTPISWQLRLTGTAVATPEPIAFTGAFALLGMAGLHYIHGRRTRRNNHNFIQ